MSCEDKHNNIANKFCPECGQKLEHFDIDAFNNEFKKYVEEKHRCFNELKRDGLIHNCYSTITDNVQLAFAFAKVKDIQQLLYLYEEVFYTQKQIMDKFQITDVEMLRNYFNNCVASDKMYYTYSTDLSAESVKKDIDKRKYRKLIQQRVFEAWKRSGIDKLCDFGSDIGSLLLDKNLSEEDVKKFLKELSDEF